MKSTSQFPAWQPIDSMPEEIKKAGTEIMFGHRLPWATNGNHTIGFWHSFQNEPGWMSKDHFIISEEVWPYWTFLPEAPE